MARDVTKDSGNWSRVRGILDLTSQGENSSNFRVRLLMYNDGTSTSYRGSGVTFAASGAYSFSETKGFSVGAGSNITVIDKTFSKNHNSDGTIGNVSVNLDISDTETSTFGNPPVVSVELTPPRIAKVPATAGTPSNTLSLPNTVTVTWDAPNNMGSGILEYQVQYSTVSDFSSGATTVSTGTSRSKALSLTIGRTWYFRVRTRNGVGWSGWSGSSSRAIPNIPDNPGTPSRSFQAPRQITVSWSAPGNNGASITGYTLQYADNASFSGAVSIDVGTATSIAVSGLDIGTTWYFRVNARNSQGTSGYSGATSYAIPSKPSAPGTPTLVISPPTTLAVSWSAPTSDGGASVTSYDVYWSTNSNFSGASSKSVTTRNTTITGLNPGSTYYVRVLANNSQGSGSYGGSANQLMYAGPRVKVGSEWKNTVAYIKVGSEWKVAIPYVKVGSEWKIAGG